MTENKEIIKLAQSLPQATSGADTFSADSEDGKRAQRIHEASRAVAEKRAPELWADISKALDAVIVRYRARICPDEVADLMKVLAKAAPVLQASEHASGPLPKGDSEAIAHRSVCLLMNRHNIEWDEENRLFLTEWGALTGAANSIEDETNLLGLIRMNEKEAKEANERERS